MMYGPEKSDLAIVAVKLANKAEQPAAERSAAKLNAVEPVERRAGTKGNADQQSTYRTQSRTSVSQALERIRQVSRERKKERFTALFQHIGTDLLEQAFSELKADAAPGVDLYFNLMRTDGKIIEDKNGGDLPSVEAARDTAALAATHLASEADGPAKVVAIIITDGEGRAQATVSVKSGFSGTKH